MQELRLRLRERNKGNPGKKTMARKQDFSAYDTLKAYHVPGTMLFYTLFYFFNSHVVYFLLIRIALSMF